MIEEADAFSNEKLTTMRAFGADLTVVPSTGGRITPDLVPRMVDEAHRRASRPGTYFTRSSLWRSTRA
jgi:cysteine synthase A